jgi:hypothetical protein
MRPPRLQHKDLLPGANTRHDLNLALQECPGLVGAGPAIKERVGISTHDVYCAAELGANGLEGNDGLGGGDGAGVSGAGQGAFDFQDVGGEGACGTVLVEDAFVADDDEGDEVELGPGLDGGQLGAGAVDAGFGDEDSEDEFETVGLGWC